MTQGGHNRSAEVVRVRAGEVVRVRAGNAADAGRLSRRQRRRPEAIASRPATRRRSKESFAVIRANTVGAAERGVTTTTTGRLKMFRIARFAAVAALVGLTLALSGQSMTAVAKPAVAKATLGDLSAACGDDDIAQFDNILGWQCATPPVGPVGPTGATGLTGPAGPTGPTGAPGGGGGAGSGFVLVDDDGNGSSFGEILSIHRIPANPYDVLQVTVLLNDDDFSSTPLGGKTVVLRLVDGLFTGGGSSFIAVLFDDTNCEEGIGDAFLPTHASFATAIAPSAVIQTGATSRQLYVATDTAVTVDFMSDSLREFDNDCFNEVQTRDVVPAAEAVANLHAAEFLLPIVLE